MAPFTTGSHATTTDASRRFVDALGRSGTYRNGDLEADAEVLLATLNGLAFRWVLEPAFDFARPCPPAHTHSRPRLNSIHPSGSAKLGQP